MGDHWPVVAFRPADGFQRVLDEDKLQSFHGKQCIMRYLIEVAMGAGVSSLVGEIGLPPGGLAAQQTLHGAFENPWMNFSSVPRAS